MLKQSLKAFKLFQHRFNILSTRFNNDERGWQTLSTLRFNKIERMLKQMLKPFARAFRVCAVCARFGQENGASEGETLEQPLDERSSGRNYQKLSR